MNPDTNATIAVPSSSSTTTENTAPPQPPVARRQPVESVLHGDLRVDDYAWLRHKEDPEVLAYLNAENAYTDTFLHQTTALQEKLYQEMLGRIQQTDLSVPYRLRGYLYFTRTEVGKQYPLHCRRADVENSPEQVLLDLNALAQGHSYLGLGSFTVSDDNQLLAFSLDTNGYRQYTLQIKDLASNETSPMRIERVTSAAWAADNRTLFYTVEDPTTKRSHRLFRHTLGSTEPGTLIYDEPEERFRVEISRTRSGAYLLLTIASHTTSEVHFLPASQPTANFKLIAPREDTHEYYVDHHRALPNANDPGATPNAAAGTFFIRTNSTGRTFRLMTVSPDDARRKFWREFIPTRQHVMLAAADVFQSHLVLFERENGLPYLRVVDLARATANVAAKSDALAASHRIEFTEPAYSASLGANPEFATHTIRFQYESFITPRSVFDYDPQTRQRTLLKQQPVLGGYDPSQYVSERLHATASDGTRIPISLVTRRNTPRDGSAPLLLYGYGSYSISIPVNFNSNRLSLLDRGVTFVIAHIRGGGELGKPWHDAGRMRNKRNTFTDFIAAAENLIAQRYTSPDRLIIEGGSAGGLLMGAVANMRPDLFRIVISHVPFVDVLNTMLDASLPLTVGEYEEWGNPQISADYEYMKSYCPYTNLETKNYPTMLVKTGLNDSQVMYWEP
ncbi:MAG TPA: S9 family peptidase, partial [Candidatus Eisenbacteria bacterium]|nr:S9 family peptidase [Candidatus Eisenbacteria bacterium]